MPDIHNIQPNAALLGALKATIALSGGANNEGAAASQTPEQPWQNYETQPSTQAQEAPKQNETILQTGLQTALDNVLGLGSGQFNGGLTSQTAAEDEAGRIWQAAYNEAIANGASDINAIQAAGKARTNWLEQARVIQDGGLMLQGMNGAVGFEMPEALERKIEQVRRTLGPGSQTGASQHPMQEETGTLQLGEADEQPSGGIQIQTTPATTHRGGHSITVERPEGEDNPFKPHLPTEEQIGPEEEPSEAERIWTEAYNEAAKTGTYAAAKEAADQAEEEYLQIEGDRIYNEAYTKAIEDGADYSYAVYAATNARNEWEATQSNDHPHPGPWTTGAQRYMDARTYAQEHAQEELAKEFTIEGYKAKLFGDEYTAKPEEAYTAENIEDHIDRIFYLGLKQNWTDEEKAEAEAILNIIAPLMQGNEFVVVDGKRVPRDTTYFDTLKVADPTEANAVWTLAEILEKRLNTGEDIAQTLRYSMGSGMGTDSIGTLLENLLGMDQGESGALYQYGETAEALQAALEQEAHPLLYGAGNMVGSVMLMHTLGSAAAPALDSIASAAPKAAQGILRAILGGAYTLGATTTIHEAGSAASDEISIGQYLKDIGLSAAEGGAGGAAAGAIGGVINNYLQNFPIAGLEGKTLALNKLARAIAAGTSGASFVAGSQAMKDIEAAIGWKEGYDPSDQEVAQEMLTMFAWATIEAWIGMRGIGQPASSTDRRSVEILNEYFDGCRTEEEYYARYKKLSKKYHPDLNPGNKEIADLYRDINSAYTYYTANLGTQAGQNRAAAQSRGDTEGTSAAERERRGAVALLQEADLSDAPQEVKDAVEILTTMHATPESEAPATTNTETPAVIELGGGEAPPTTNTETPAVIALGSGEEPTTVRPGEARAEEMAPGSKAPDVIELPPPPEETSGGQRTPTALRAEENRLLAEQQAAAEAGEETTALPAAIEEEASPMPEEPEALTEPAEQEPAEETALQMGATEEPPEEETPKGPGLLETDLRARAGQAEGEAGETPEPETTAAPQLTETEATNAIGQAAENNSPVAQGPTAAARRDKALDLMASGSPQLGSIDIGVTNAGDGSAIKPTKGEALVILPEKTWDAEMSLVNAWSQQTLGKPVTFVQGDIFGVNPDRGKRTPVTYDAAYTNDGIVIKADSRDRTVTRIFEDDILKPLREGTYHAEAAKQGTAPAQPGRTEPAKDRTLPRGQAGGLRETDTRGTVAAAGPETSVSAARSDVSGGNGGREPGGRAGGISGGLGGNAGTGRGIARPVRRRDVSFEQHLGDVVRTAGGRQVSSRELGVRNGTDERKMTVIPEKYWKKSWVQEAERIRQETGYETMLVQGPIEVTLRSGAVISNGAMIDFEGSRIVARTDHDLWTVLQLMRHEKFHALAAKHPGLVETIANQIRSYGGVAREQMTGMLEEYIIRRRGIGNESDLDILEEIFADAHGNMDAFGAGAPRLQEYVDAEIESAEKLQGTGENVPAAQEANGVQQTRGPPANKFSYGGESAWEGDFEALSTAEQLEAQGVDNEEIRRQTGWFRGMDDRWRFEIDDSAMELRDDYKDYLDNQHNELGLRLFNIINHSNLFNQYPQLANVDVAFDIRRDAGNLGIWKGWNGGDGHISVNEKLLEEGQEGQLLDTLLHEIQHAIQEGEGFASGSSPDAWQRRINQGYDNRRTEAIRASQEAENRLQELSESEPEYYQEMMALIDDTPKMPRGEIDWDTLEPIEEDPIEWQEWDARRDALEEKYGDRIFNIIDLVHRVNSSRANPRSAYDLYYHTAGEIEARDSESRRGMTAEQRKSTPPNLGNENTVFVGQDGVSLSAEDPEILHLKDQLKAAENILSEMEPVADIKAPTQFPTRQSDRVAWAKQELKKYGKIIDVPEFGKINLGDRIDRGMNYTRTEADRAGFLAIPAVLKRGKIIGHHEKHKGGKVNSTQNVESWTFGAPVIINGEPGNMGVIVQKTTGLYYKAHKVLMPNGSAFLLSEIKEAESGPVQGATENGRLVTPTDSASEMNIAQAGEESKTKFSTDEESLDALETGEYNEEAPETKIYQLEESSNTSIEGALYGKRGRTYNGTRPVEFTYAIVPLESLTVSNMPDGTINPSYPQELQPRDRTRADSLRQVMDFAKNPIPEKLEESADVQNGAPLIRRDGVVISGNGRSMGLELAYGKGTAEGYRDYLTKNAEKWGLDPEQMPERPVLVRIADDGQDWEQLARDANVSTIAGKSASEQARTDAKNLMRHPEILEELVTNEDGDLNTTANRDFIGDFINAVIPENERGMAHDSNGLLTRDGLERVQHALFEAAYGDAGLLEKLSERLDNDMKNVTNALLSVAPKAVAFEAAAADGTRYDLQPRDYVLEGVRIYTDAKQNGMTVAERTANYGLDTPPSNEGIYIARMLERNKGSGKQLRTFLNAIFDAADEIGDPNQIGFFEEEEGEHSFDEVLKGAIDKYEQATGRQLPRPEHWGAGTLEEIGETRGLKGKDLDDYYLADQRGVDTRPDGRNPGENAGGQEPVPPRDSESTGEDGRRGSDLGRGELTEQPAEPEAPKTEEPKPAATKPAAPAEEPGLSPGAKRVLDQKRAEERAVEQGRKKRRPQTEFPKYKPANEEDGKIVQNVAGEVRSKAAAASAASTENGFDGTKALEKIGVKVQSSVGNYRNTKQVRAVEKAAYDLKRTIRRREKDLNATAKEKQLARGIAAGIFTPEDLGPKVKRAVIEELADYYQIEQAMDEDLLPARRREVTAMLDGEIRKLLEGVVENKIPPMYVLNHRTPERLLRNIYGDEKGAEIYDKIFRPVADNEAEKIRWIAKQFDDVRLVEGADGKKSELTKPERVLAQQVLEGRAAEELVAGMELDDGKAQIESVAQSILNGEEAADAAREQGLTDRERGIAEQYARWLQTKAILDSGEFDAVKIDNAVELYKEKYNLMYDAINDFLVAHGYQPIGFIRGYAPHMQMEEDLNVFAGYLKSLGVNEDVTRLPASIAGKTAGLKPNKRWNPYFLTRKGDFTDFDIAKGFQSYVGYLGDIFYHMDDIMRVRAMSRYYREMAAPENIKQNLEWARGMGNVAPEVRKEVLQDRGIIAKDAAMSNAEVNDAFDKWIDDQFKAIADETKASDLVMWLDNYANILAGKQSMSDRGGEYDFGRESLTKANKWVTAFARTQVAGNLSSAMAQLSQIPMITAELGPKYLAAAVRDYVNGTLKKTNFVQQSRHLTERKGSGALVTDRFDMVMDKMFTPLRVVDGFTAAVAVRGKYLKEIEAGKSHEEAMKAADDYGTRVQGSRAKGTKPLAFHSKKLTNQMLHMFQLELFNSWEHVSQDIPKDFRDIEKEYGKSKAIGALAKVLLGYLMTAFLINRLTEETYGGTPAPFDLMGITSNFIASGYGLTTNRYLETVMDNVLEKITGERLLGTEDDERREEFQWGDAASGAWYEIGSDIPYLRNVMGLMGLGDQSLPLPLMGLGDELKYFWKDLKADISNGQLTGQTGLDLLRIMNQLVPGGRQLTKTEEGLQVMTQGGRYINGKLYYPVENTFGNWVKALLFGRSALEESDAYYAGDDKALTVGATELYKLMTGQGSAEDREAYEALQGARTLNEDQTQYLKDFGDEGGDTWLLWQTMQEYKTIANDKELGSYEKGRKERECITNALLTDKERLEVYRVMDKNNEGKADKIEAIMDSGLTWKEAVRAYDAYAEISANETLSKKEQAEQWASWVNHQSYTAEQKDTIRETIKFWGSYAIEETTTDKIADGTNLSADQVDKVTEILSGLEPEPGATKVTDLQKYQAIVNDSGLSIEDQWEAILAITPESYTSTIDKIGIMREMGITPSVWTESKEAMYAADDAGNDNDSTDQSEAKSALDGMDISNEQKAILWQLTNKSWSYKKNPYDTEIGLQVYNLLHGTEESSDKTSSKKSGRSGGGSGGYRGGSRGGSKSSKNKNGGLTLGAAAPDSGRSGWYDTILNGWKRRKYSRAQILAFVRQGLLTQAEADEILATAQDEEDDGALKLGA